jgi:uncharacterized integral membrane protein (TIGR00697 family)
MLEQTANISNPTTQNIKELKYLSFFCMIYMSVMLCNVILTNRYVSLSENVFVLGGTLTSPFFFILGDIIAELFGYKIARQIIWFGFIGQILFALVCEFIIHMPYPIFFKDYQAYSLIFGQLFRLISCSFIAFIFSGLVNVYIITKWKVLLKGRYFWLRSLGSSTLSEALYSAIAITMMEINSIPTGSILKVILISYSIKVIYSVVFAGPANILVNFIKRNAKIDFFDAPVKTRIK